MQFNQMQTKKLTNVRTNTRYFKPITVNNLWCTNYLNVRTNTSYFLSWIIYGVRIVRMYELIQVILEKVSCFNEKDYTILRKWGSAEGDLTVLKRW